MKISEIVDTMESMVETYHKIEDTKAMIADRIYSARESASNGINKLKGGCDMKFGTVIGIVVGALALIAAGAAAMYFFLEGCPFCKDEEDDDELFDDFPEEEVVTDAEEAKE